MFKWCLGHVLVMHGLCLGGASVMFWWRAGHVWVVSRCLGYIWAVSRPCFVGVLLVLGRCAGYVSVVCVCVSCFADLVVLVVYWFCFGGDLLMFWWCLACLCCSCVSGSVYVLPV